MKVNNYYSSKHPPLALAISSILGSVLCLPATTYAAQTTLVSVAGKGTQGNQASDQQSISSDGRYVAFVSSASNLVAGDSNNTSDIFVRDLKTNKIKRVSVADNGTQSNRGSYRPVISADGRYVVFESNATNLVINDSNNTNDIFTKDILTGQITRVSVSSSGAEGNGFSSKPSISADGRFVAFASGASNLVQNDTNNSADIFVRDLTTLQTTRVSLTNSGSQSTTYDPYYYGLYFDNYDPSISADGRFVAFVSLADNLVEGDTNGAPDVFVRDLKAQTTTRVSVASDGTQGNYVSISFHRGGSIFSSYQPSISSDGRFVAFTSYADNLIIGDSNKAPDIFIHDLKTKQTTRVSVASDGTQGNSTYGAYMYYSSSKSNISSDGRYVTFASSANNLVSGDTNGTLDIFVKDMKNNKTDRLSIASTGIEGNGDSFNPSISADGSLVVFSSNANNLVAGDTNAESDVFLRKQFFTPTSGIADLSVKEKVFTKTVAVGSIFNYLATIKNLSSDYSSGYLTLTSIAPLQGQVSMPLAITPTQGYCSKGLISICNLGQLSAGQQASVQFTFKALQTGTVSNRVSINTGRKDPIPGNDSAKATVTIR